MNFPKIIGPMMSPQQVGLIKIRTSTKCKPCTYLMCMDSRGPGLAQLGAAAERRGPFKISIGGPCQGGWSSLGGLGLLVGLIYSKFRADMIM